MAYRFTQTDKWKDGWFSALSIEQKLLFIYITDTCDIAGFIEFTPRIWAAETGIDEKKITTIINSMGKAFIWSAHHDCLYVRNFLKHQNNWPLNTLNKAHVGILKRFKYYAPKFGIELSIQPQTGKDGVDVEQIEWFIAQEYHADDHQEQQQTPKPSPERKQKAFIPPSEQDVIDYFIQNGYSAQAAEKAFKYYHEANWKDRDGKQVKNWKQKMIGVWFKEENKARASAAKKESEIESMARKANMLAQM